ncbi:sugar transporter, partial [mine drainage metagenome]
MSLRLVQIEIAAERCVAALVDEGHAHRLDGVASVYELATQAIASGLTLQEAVSRRSTGQRIELEGVRLLPPIDHPDPAHLYLTGTGLTHLGSAESRDKMHA